MNQSVGVATPPSPDASARPNAARVLRVVLVHYMDSAAVGGSVRIGELLGKMLPSANVEPHFVFAYDGPGPIARETTAACHFIHAKGPGDPRAWIRVRRLIGKLRPDIIHFVNPVFWMSLALFANKSPKLLHVHGPMSPPASPFGDRCIWNAFRYIMRGHVCVSRDMENMLLNAKWAAPDRTFTIYNAVDCSHWAVRRDKARAALGLPKDTVILGMICRLVADKGCSDGVRLLRRLPEQFHLAIAGEGPEKSNIVKLAAANGLSHRVHLLGLLDDARLAYSSVDNLLFLSRKEPFGLLLAEAMAAGVPIVGLSGQGGYREKDYPLVTRETAALLDRPDPEDTVTPTSDLLLDHLATTIQGLNASPESRDAMAHRAQTWVRERFGGERYAGLMAGLYRKLLREE